MVFVRQLTARVTARLLAASAVMLSLVCVSAAQPIHGPQVGTVYTITRTLETSETGGSASESFDRDRLTERVVRFGEDGLELEFDLPKNVSAEDRAKTWHFPIRVLKPIKGALRLLDEPEMKARVDPWLKRMGLTRAVCGHYYFTWNAFQTDCDPQAIMPALEAFDLWSGDLRDGATYTDPRASGATPLTKTSVGSGEARFTGRLVVDPEQVRRDEAVADVVVAEIYKQTLTLPDAIRARMSERISGTVDVTLETDSAGSVRLRRRHTTLDIVSSAGARTTRTIDETVERTP